ncbi:MAG: DNRLRE domain-containing protein [Desulfobacterales bacterium]|nr:DNRLRE domain-containing protein [Desulfobacterales bacterium]
MGKIGNFQRIILKGAIVLIFCLGAMAVAHAFQTIVLYPEADGYRSVADKTLGKFDVDFYFRNTAGAMPVGNPTENIWHGYGYFRFDLSGLDLDKISRASLRLYNRYYSKRFVERHREKIMAMATQIHGVADDSWDERTMIPLGAPKATNYITTQQGVRMGWNIFDVTPFVTRQGDGRASFQVGITGKVQSDMRPCFVTREGRRDWRPQLVLTYDSNETRPRELPGKTTSILPWNSVWRFSKGRQIQYEDTLDSSGNITVYAAQKAIDHARPGDEIVFGPGRHYQTFDVRKGVSGTREKPITIRGDGKPRPILDASGVKGLAGYGRGMIAIGPGKQFSDHIVIENLEIKDASRECGFTSNASAIYVVRGRHITVRDVYAHHNGNGIFVTHYGEKYRQENCEIAYNGYYGGGHHHGHYLCARGMTIRYNHIHHNGGNGYKDRGSDTLFAYNYIHDNGNYELDFMGQNKEETPQNATLVGNVVVKSPFAVNRFILMLFGGEKKEKCFPLCATRGGATARLVNNTFIIPTRAPSRSFLFLSDPFGLRRDMMILDNNIFYAADPGKNTTLVHHDKSREAEAMVRGTNNWVSTRVAVRAKLGGTLTGTDPGFYGYEDGLYFLGTGSVNIDAGNSQARDLPSEMYLYPRFSAQRTIRGTAVDIGAYEH